MEEYLLDRETLEKLVDESMKKHPLPANSAEELTQYREQQIKALDDHIAQTVFGSLNEEQSNQLEQLLDNEEEAPETFRDFFRQQGINIEETIADAINSFNANFLKGGQNA